MEIIYALLVGINEYAGKGIPQLRGPERDIIKIQDYLLSLEIPDKRKVHVCKLAGKDATKEAVVNCFTTFFTPAGKNDHALFYFSGHGALEYAHDVFNKLDRKEFLETLVCYDSIEQATTLADKELRYLIHKLSSRCNNVLILLDCCHSGGATRNSEMILKRLAEEVPARQWNEFIFKDELSEEKVSSAASLTEILPEGTHIQLSACESRQSAWEVRGSAIFTANLLQVLLQTQGSIGYLDLYSRVKYLVANRFDQVPHIFISAVNRRQYGSRLFLGGATADLSSLNANIVFNNPVNSWILDKGAIQGIRQVTETFDLEVRNAAGQPPVTLARIVSILPDHSRIELKDPGIPKQGYYTTINGLYQKELGIFITGEKEEDAGIKNLQTYYKDHSVLYQGEGIRLATEYSQADYVIVASGNAYFVLRPNESTKPNELKPLIRVIAEYTDLSAEEVFNSLIKISRWEYVKSLQNAQTVIKEFPFELAFEFADEQKNIQHMQPDVDGQVTCDYDIYISNNNNPQAIRNTKISLTNTSSMPYHGSVIYLGIAFDIDTEFFSEEVVFADKNKTLWLNDGKEFTFYQESYTTEFNLPNETAWLLVIASTVKFEIGSIKQDALLLPEKTRRRRDLPGAAAKSAPRSQSLPAEDWCTKLIKLQFGNPFYKTTMSVNL